MNRLILALSLILSMSLSLHGERVGLVLSGGGAKGIAHVGVIKALEDNDIPIDYVTGTSMGAIVGSLYACGMSPDEMMQLFTSAAFADWSSGRLDPHKTYYFSRPQESPQLVSVNFSKPDSANIFNYIPANLINPMPMNLEFLRLYGPYTLQCSQDFDRLFVPFRCVTSDIYHKHKVVCRSGSLSESVRQSMSFPLVYKPIERDGVLVYDGGIYDNFPVDVMTEDFHPDFIIGSNVSGPDGPPKPGNVYSQLQDMIIQNNDYSLADSLGVKIDVPVRSFSVLDFGKAAEIYEIGYRQGLEMVDSIKARVSARRPASDVRRRRDVFKTRTPQLRFDSIATKNTTAPQSQYLRYVFNPTDSASIGMDQVENAYYRIVSTGMVSDLEPQMVSSGVSQNTLVLTPSINDRWNLGLGGWLTSTNNNMLYLSGSYKTLRFNALDAALSIWLGQSYLSGMLDVKMELQRHTASYVRLTSVVSRTKYYNDRHWFYQFSEPSFVTDHENYVKLAYCRAFSRKTLTYASLGYSYRYDDYYADPLGSPEGDKDRSRFGTLATTVGAKGSTLNHVMYPTSGWRFDMSASLLWQRASWRVNSVQSDGRLQTGQACNFRGLLQLEACKYFPVIPNFVVGGYVEGAATLGPLIENYNAQIMASPRFQPVPCLLDYFNAEMLSPNFIALGVVPVWQPMSGLQVRGDFYVYNPIRNLKKTEDLGVKYHGWFGHTRFMGQVAAVYTLGNASLSVYANYLEGQRRPWHFGVNFGLLIPAPKFL